MIRFFVKSGKSEFFLRFFHVAAGFSSVFHLLIIKNSSSFVNCNMQYAAKRKKRKENDPFAPFMQFFGDKRINK